jgi:hypothetical protein
VHIEEPPVRWEEPRVPSEEIRGFSHPLRTLRDERTIRAGLFADGFAEARAANGRSSIASIALRRAIDELAAHPHRRAIRADLHHRMARFLAHPRLVRYDRDLVIGASGSGKTTFARSLAARLVEWRVVRRSLARWVRRTELYNGNREPSPLGWFDPEHPVRWSWKKHGEYRVRYADRFADPAWARVTRVRLRSRAEVSAFISASPATEPGRG